MGRFQFYAMTALAAALFAAVPATAERKPSATDTREVWRALSVAPDGERAAWRWRLARDYAVRGLYAEADGVLRVLAADTPERASVRDFRLLHAEVLTALGEGEAALALLDTPIVEGAPETCLRRLAASAALQRHAEVRAAFACADTALQQLPGADRTPYLMAAVRAEMALGDERMAESLLSRMALDSAEAGEAQFWRGVIARRRGQPALAADHFQMAVEGANPVAALRAEVALVEMRADAGSLTPKAALARLSELAHDWRGGAAERDLLTAAGRLSERTQDVRGAFSSYGAAALYLPPDPAHPPLREMLSARFAAIFADGGQSLRPVDAFALFWDFRDFAPQGPAADAIVRRLADRLASLGLSAQAASLLEHQVYNRLQGTARGIVAVRLASLLNDGGHYARALNVIAATRADSVPADVEAERNLVEARALIGAGRPQDSKPLLAGRTGEAATGLRAEAAWAARDWGAVIDLLEDGLPPRDAAAEPAELARLLRLAVAAAMDGDEVLLRRLNRDYAGVLAPSDVGPAFEVLTGDPGKLPPGALRAALAEAAERASG